MNKFIENRPKALIYALACVVSWAFIPVVARFGQQSLDNYQFLFWSSLLSFIVLLTITIVAGKFNGFWKYKPIDWVVSIILGFLGSFLYYILLYFGYAHAKGLEVLALQYTWPVFIVVFSIALLKERLTKSLIISSILGFIGVLIVLTKGNFTNIYLGDVKTDLVVLLAASVFGLFSVLSKKVNYESYTVTTIFFASATLFSLLAMNYFSTFVIPTTSSLIPLVINGAIINGISYVLWLLALKNAKASYVAQFVFLTPVLAALLIVLFFHETFTPIYLIGMSLVVGAGLVAQKNI